MGNALTITIDDVKVPAKSGQTILQAADDAGIYIPRLCAFKHLIPLGACRVCVVMVNGRPQAACTYPIADGMKVESETEEIQALRKDIIDMLFVEGNHFCMFCERSGNCELQALAYRFGITAPKFPYLSPKREVDGSHPDIMIDRNRCVLCGRCVRASTQLDNKHIFDFVGRGSNKQVAINAKECLRESDISVTDKAVESCPVGAIIKKRTAFKVPIGKRTYDQEPIGSSIEKNKQGT